MTRLAVLLQATRKKQNISQVELAERIGVHFNTLSRAENGGKPNRNNLKRMAEFLGEPVDALLAEVGSDTAVGEVIGGGRGASMLPPAAATRLEQFALQAGTSPGEWLGRLLEWIEHQPALWREFLISTVAATRTEAEADELQRRGPAHVRQSTSHRGASEFPEGVRRMES